MAKRESKITKRGISYRSHVTSGFPKMNRKNILKKRVGVPHPKKGNLVFEKYTSYLED